MTATYNASAAHERFQDLADLRRFARKLVELWDRGRGTSFKMKIEYINQGGPLIWSYTQHSVELMRTILDLSAQDRMVIAVPLIRLMVENAMTSIWVYLSPPATRAVVHEGLRQQRAAIADIIKVGAEGFDESNLDEVNKKLKDFEGDNLPAGQHFDQRCKQIVAGLGVYASWRILSSLSHAGMALGDFYLVETHEPPYLILNEDARLDYHEAWFGTAICMLIVSMKACDLIDARGGHKTQLERAARRMGISLDFALVDEQSTNGAQSAN
jgi:hypothetical protein